METANGRRKNAEVQLQEAIDRLWDRSIILKDDEKREEFRRSVKESLSGPVRANRSDGIKPGIGIERKNYTYHYFCCWRTAREKALRRMMAYAVQTEMPVITQEIG